MSDERIYIGNFDGGCITDPDAVGHIRKVLRLKADDVFSGYDGLNKLNLRIKKITREEAFVEVISREEIPVCTRQEIILAPALIKAARWETLLEKSVELGVSEIRPVVSERCVVRPKDKDFAGKTDRWMKIMNAAAAQCAGRRPELAEPAPLDEVIETAVEIPNKYILDGEGAEPFGKALRRVGPGKIILLIGPEGDWAEDEREEAVDAGFEAVSMGPRKMRSETAALAAVALAAGMTGYIGD